MSEPSSAAPPGPAPPARTEPPSRFGTSQAAAPDDTLQSLRWVALVHGGVTLVIGALLLFTPGRTLAFVATLAGISLCLIAAIDLFRALRRGITGGERLSAFGMALLAGAAGIVVIARPEGSIKTVAVVAGLYLLILGVMSLVVGTPGVRRSVSALRGAIALAAGVALVAWPDVTVGTLAAIYGAFLLAFGAAELFVGFRLSRARSAPPPG